MNSFKELYAKLGGYTGKPKEVYTFHLQGIKQSLRTKGQVITRSAHSPAQAVRFFKRAYPAYQYKNIEAKKFEPSFIKTGEITVPLNLQKSTSG